MKRDAVKIGSFGAPLALLAATLLALAAVLLTWPPSAEADLSFCPDGSGAGQCDDARGVAVDWETGRLFVADRFNNRVNVFAPDGDFLFAIGWGVADGTTAAFQKCTSDCFKGLAGSGVGQFNAPARVAVDNVVGSASQHAVYVFDAGNLRVQKFDADGNHLLTFGSSGECQINTPEDPLAVGPGGVVYLGDSVGFDEEAWARKFEPNGTCIEAVRLGHDDRLNGDIAVDSAGDIYGKFNKGGGIFKFHPDGSKFGSPYPLDPPVNGLGLGLDQNDNLYASQTEPLGKGFGIFNVITAYTPAGAPFSRFGYGKLANRSPGIAFLESADGDVFASDNDPTGAVKYLSLPAPGPIAAPPSLEVKGLSNTKATLVAEINPEGKASEYRFEYVSEEDFEAQGGFEGPATKSTEAKAVPMPAGTEYRLRGVEGLAGCLAPTPQLIAEGKCLTPETEYRFRVIATNADNPTGTGEARAEGPSFITLKSLEIEELFATEVGTDAASLHAALNPLGIPASGYFEYVDEASFQQSGFTDALKTAEIDFGSGNVGVERSITISPLLPGTTYRYRLLATNALLEGETLPSEVKAITTFRVPDSDPCPQNATFRSGAGALLPDCRAYEMVSPLDKEGGEIKVQFDLATKLPAVLNQSAVSGGKLAFGSYRAFGDAKSAPYTSQYISVRTEGGWESHGISPPREVVVQGEEKFDTEFRRFSEDLCEAWIASVAEAPLAVGAIAGIANLYRKTDSAAGCNGGPQPYEALAPLNPPPGPAGGELFKLELQGASTDGETTVFVANDNLTPKAPSLASGPQAYAARGGALGFLCVLPGGAASNAPCTAGGPVSSAFVKTRQLLAEGAVSGDGNRIVWTGAGGAIFQRQSPFAAGPECTGPGSPCTVAVSKEGEEESGTLGSQYWGADEEGAKAVYSTGSLASGAADLYEFAVEGEETQLIAGELYGLVGMSEDGSRVYLISGEAGLGGSAGAVAGKPNLYLYEANGGGGSYRFIATLAAADAVQSPGDTGSSAASARPATHATRVSPDGEAAAFMSVAPLTGYDNTDAANGEADAEVFLYDAGAEGGQGELVCVSCNPGGGRPVGEDVQSGTGEFWVAGRIPVWENILYAPRALSEDGGRLYFESFDSLVARDTNSRQDVYQWERAGRGLCDKADPSFSAAAGGCIDLISSGQSLKDSGFIDASPSGDDVFFTTLSSLRTFDFGLIDIYDARVGGGLPEPPTPAIECVGETCQNPPPPPEVPVPASLTYAGQGDALPEKPRKGCPKGKKKVKRGGKSVCVKKKSKQGGAKKRPHRGRAGQ